MLSIKKHETNKSKCTEKERYRREHAASPYPYDISCESKLISSETNNDDHIPYDISYSRTTTNRSRLYSVTPLTSYIYDEKVDFFEQRLSILKEHIMHNSIQLNKLLVYISLEYILNGNPNATLLKELYDALDTNNESIINGHSLYNYLKRNKSEWSEYIHLNGLDHDAQISHCCEWKLTEIFSLYLANKSTKIKYKQSQTEIQDIQRQHCKLKQKLKLKQNELNEMKQQCITLRNKLPGGIPIIRTTNTAETSINKEWTVTAAPRYRTISRHTAYDDIIQTKKALIVWRQYTDRLIYIKQRYPSEYINRRKAWHKWSLLLNKIEETGTADTASSHNIWQYIDFARMSLGRYCNWIWYPKHAQNAKNIKWKRKYLVLMDFNLFLFDSKTEPQCLKQTLSFKHMVLSIASIQNIVASPRNSTHFTLALNGNNCIELRCDSLESRRNWMDEIIYQMKCIQDLLKIPNVTLRSADPHGNIWVPFPVGFQAGKQQ